MNPPIVNPDIGSDDDDDGDPIIVNPLPSFNKDACKDGVGEICAARMAAASRITATVSVMRATADKNASR